MSNQLSTKQLIKELRQGVKDRGRIMSVEQFAYDLLKIVEAIDTKVGQSHLYVKSLTACLNYRMSPDSFRKKYRKEFFNNVDFSSLEKASQNETESDQKETETTQKETENSGNLALFLPKGTVTNFEKISEVSVSLISDDKKNNYK